METTGHTLPVSACCKCMKGDKGSQFKGAACVTTLTEADVKISMPLGDFANHLPVIDGRGRYLDNIFIERLWRSLKQKAVYLHELQDGFQAKRVIKDWIRLYNTKRPLTTHSSTQNDPRNRHETNQITS